MAGAPSIKFPDGNLGIILSSSDERKQEDIYHPTNPMLVAVNVNGDPEMGTLVWDLNEQNEYDSERWARLQSIFRVIKEPFKAANSIAIQLGPAGQSDSGGGLFTDLGDGGNVQINEIAIGHGSYSQGGPFHVGHVNDKHRKGTDWDDNPINSLHIWHRFNLYKSKREDGPLRIETYQPPDKDLNKKIPVHFGWDDGAQDWAWWTTSVLYYPPTPTPVPFPGIPTEGPHPITVPHLTPFPVPTPTSPATNTDVATPSRATATPGGLNVETDTSFSGPDAIPGATPTITGNSRVSLPLGLAFGDSMIATPGYAMRAQNYAASQTDTGVFAPSDAGSKKGQTSNPVCGIGSCFGAQGGDITNASGQTSKTGGEGDPWVYTAVPKGQVRAGTPTSKFIGGTASGGLVIHPPEVDLRDVGDMTPDNVTLSTTYLLCAPNAYFGAGTPELVNGAIKDGYSWGVDTSTGDLIFRTHSNSGAPSNAIKFDVSGQDISWTSGTGFYASLSHDNTAARAYDFPNRTGTVIVVASPATYSITNVTTDRTYDADATTLAEIADVLGTLVSDLRAMGAVL